MATMRLDIALTFAVCFELFAYGIYTTLMCSAALTYLTRRMVKRTHSTSWVFIMGSFVIYLLATLHLALELYRFLLAFITNPLDPNGGVSFMYDFTQWVTIFSNCVFGVVAWSGNALVIIRCYYVWNKNIWIVMIPILILTATIGINIYVMYFLSHVHDPTLNLSFSLGMSLLRAVYILSFIQNIITTSLISLKIYIQHATFGANPPVIKRGFGATVERVTNIMVESAMFYTLQIFLVMVLHLCDNNAQYMIQSVTVPTTGVIFLLITIRVLTAKVAVPVKRSNIGQEWLGERNDAIEFSTSKASITPGGGGGGVVSLRMSADNLDRDDYSDPSGSSSFTHKRNRNHSRDSPI